MASPALQVFFFEVNATAKKAIIGLTGGSVLLLGIAMLILPGPAFLVIPAGLAILATEFVWAHKLTERFKARFEYARARHREKRAQKRAMREPADDMD